MSVLHLISRKNFITFNKEIAKIIGLHEALLLGELCSICDLYGEEFFFTQDKISNDTCLSEYQIQKALKTLQEKNIVSVKKRGIPCKNYYKINEYAILELLGTSTPETRPLETEKLDNLQQNNSITISNNTNNNNTNNNTYIDRATDTDKPEKKKTTSFQKPTVDEVRAYCEERGNNIDPEKFIDYYNSNGWKVGKSPMKDWKATIRNWERNEKERNTPKNMQDPDKLYF